MNKQLDVWRWLLHGNDVGPWIHCIFIATDYDSKVQRAQKEFCFVFFVCNTAGCYLKWWRPWNTADWTVDAEVLILEAQRCKWNIEKYTILRFEAKWQVLDFILFVCNQEAVGVFANSEVNFFIFRIRIVLCAITRCVTMGCSLTMKESPTFRHVCVTGYSRPTQHYFWKHYCCL